MSWRIADFKAFRVVVFQALLCALTLGCARDPLAAAVPPTPVDLGLDLATPAQAADAAMDDRCLCRGAVPKELGNSTVVATNQIFRLDYLPSTRIAANMDSIFWFTTTGIMRARRGGGAPEELVKTHAEPSDLVIDDKFVYYIEGYYSDAKLWKMPLAGGVPTMIVTDAHAIAVDDTNLYWTSSNYDIQKIEKNGGGPIVLAMNDQLPMSLRAFENSVYWVLDVDTHSMLSVSADGGMIVARKQLGEGVAPFLDNAQVFFVDFPSRGPDYCQSHSLVVAGSLRALPDSILVDRPDTLDLELALDSSGLYFSAWVPGTIERVPRAGGPPTILVSGECAPNGLLADRGELFWATRDGRLMRLLIPGQ